MQELPNCKRFGSFFCWFARENPPPPGQFNMVMTVLQVRRATYRSGLFPLVGPHTCCAKSLAAASQVKNAKKEKREVSGGEPDEVFTMGVGRMDETNSPPDYGHVTTTPWIKGGIDRTSDQESLTATFVFCLPFSGLLLC
jgi:hypothetical protein